MVPTDSAHATEHEAPASPPSPSANPLSFAETTRVRVLALIWFAGTTPAELSVKLGRHFSWLAKKLHYGDGVENEDRDRRNIMSAEVDEVLVALGLPVDAVLEPALGPDGKAILRWIMEATDGYRTASAVRRFVSLHRSAPGGDASRKVARDVKLTLKHLENQKLILRSGAEADGADEYLYLTEYGLHCART